MTETIGSAKYQTYQTGHPTIKKSYAFNEPRERKFESANCRLFETLLQVRRLLRAFLNSGFPISYFAYMSVQYRPPYTPFYIEKWDLQGICFNLFLL